MISFTLAASLVLYGFSQGNPAPGPHWPLVPDPLFAVNGIAHGEAGLQHVSVAVRNDGATVVKPAELKDPTSSEVTLPPGLSRWRTIEVMFTSAADGTLLSFGDLSVAVKQGRLWFARNGHMWDIAPLKADSLNDVQLVTHLDSYLAYVNGQRSAQTITVPAAIVPIQVGLDTWKGSVIGVCGYAKELSEDEVVANLHAGQAVAKAVYADTKTVTIEAELGAFTAVPELSQIAPYRSALVAEEYKILRISKGRMAALKEGMKVRIFRWGLKAGDKTDIAKIKTGDKATMVIQPLSADPKYEKEFQVDTLDGDISALYFVDVTPAP